MRLLITGTNHLVLVENMDSSFLGFVFDNDADVFEFAEWDFHPRGHQVRLRALMESCTFLYTEDILHEFVGLNCYGYSLFTFIEFFFNVIFSFFM